jgi:hypothetical protein
MLTMGKRTMKEWVIEHIKPADYKKDLPIFKEAKASSKQGSAFVCCLYKFHLQISPKNSMSSPKTT